MQFLQEVLAPLWENGLGNQCVGSGSAASRFLQLPEHRYAQILVNISLHNYLSHRDFWFPVFLHYLVEPPLSFSVSLLYAISFPEEAVVKHSFNCSILVWNYNNFIISSLYTSYNQIYQVRNTSSRLLWMLQNILYVQSTVFRE